MSGYVLPVDKPPGPTSHDIVAMARRALGTRRIGHTGTLDPFASGLLLLCIGNATRVAEYLTGLPKTYEAVLRLDGSTTTDDATGEFLSHTAGWRTLSDQQVESALQTQHGTIQQQPPIYSAKKVTGQRAYELARAGAEVALASVTVTIYEIEPLRVSLPDVTFRVVCSSGTYVRALARDVGALLGTGGYLSELRRTAIGEHHVSTALQPVEMIEGGRVRAAALTPVQALRHLPTLELSEQQEQAVRHGQAISTEQADLAPLLLVRDGELVAVAEASSGRVRPRKVFAT